MFEGSAVVFKVDSKESLREALIKLTERPGLYVGADRLDYLENFSAGWGFVTSIYPWASDYEIQEWIFLRESVSINSASIHGRSLVPRCYGNRKEAIAQYKILLEEVKFSRWEDEKPTPSVSRLITGITSSFEEEGYDFYAYCAPAALRQVAKELVGEVQHSYESIIPIVSRIIGEAYDDLWVYLHFAGCFVCVKFLYHTEKDGWKENTALLNREDYVQKLLILHAYAVFVQEKENKSHIITLRHKQGIITVDCKETADEWRGICSDYENKPFSESYAEWKEGIIRSP